MVIKLGVGMHWEGGGRDPDVLGAGEGGQALSAHPKKEKGIIHCGYSSVGAEGVAQCSVAELSPRARLEV